MSVLRGFGFLPYFPTRWTRILRSFLILFILLRSLGIWQPLVRCLPCPGYTEKLDFLLDDFSHYFLRAPCTWQSLYCVRCCLWSIGLWIFREMTPGMVSVLNPPRFDSGYKFGVSLRGLVEEFHMLALVFQRYAWFNSGYKFMRQTTEAGFTGCDAPRAVFVWTRRNVMCRRAENCGFSAVAVPHRSCSSSCRCAVAVSYGPDCCWTKRFPSCLIR